MVLMRKIAVWVVNTNRLCSEYLSKCRSSSHAPKIALLWMPWGHDLDFAFHIVLYKYFIIHNLVLRGKHYKSLNKILCKTLSTQYLVKCVYLNIIEITACQPYEHRCPDGECISQTVLCDEVDNCSDGSDEANCTKSGCAANEFRCERDNRCLPSWQRCDRQRQCSDGSDEVGCRKCFSRFSHLIKVIYTPKRKCYKLKFCQ